MTATLIDGKVVAQELQDRLTHKVMTHVSAGKRPPGLTVVLVGDDPPSQIYVSKKEQAARKMGINGGIVRLPANATQSEVELAVVSLNADPGIDGILVQLPLPKHLNEKAVLEKIDPHKDVDGLTAYNQGLLALNEPGFVPCTPKGVMALLRNINCELKGKIAAVVGRSRLVGAPVARLLTHAHATVIQIHSRSVHPRELTRLADVLVVAAGVPNLVTSDWIKPEAVVIDVGIHRVAGKLSGDVDFENVRAKASYITPVPGGVGPMTIASLLENTVEAYEKKWC